MKRSFAVLAIAAMALAVMWGAAFAQEDQGIYTDIYTAFYARSKLIDGKTTRESYTNDAITACWDFETSPSEWVDLSQTLTFNAAARVILDPEGGRIQVKAGETRTFDRKAGEWGWFYPYYELYNDWTDDEREQTAISGAPFTVNIDGETISGQVGVMHSVREMVDSKCVPTIELIGENAITSVKWAFVRSPDFTAPVKRSAENDVAHLIRFEFRAQNNQRFPRYRCFVEKDFADGEELSGEMVIADVKSMTMRENAESPWKPVAGLKSIPLDLSSCEIQYFYDDGYVNNVPDKIDTRTRHIWRFTDVTLAPANVSKPEAVELPTPEDEAISSVECTGTNADVPDDLDLDGANIEPSADGETNTVGQVIATVTIKVDYDKDKIGDDSEIDVEIAGDFSRFADRLSNLFALIKNNDDHKYHKFSVISATATGLRFKLKVKGFFSEKVVTIAELKTSSPDPGPGPDPDPKPGKSSRSSSGCTAGAAALVALVGLAAIKLRAR